MFRGKSFLIFVKVEPSMVDGVDGESQDGAWWEQFLGLSSVKTLNAFPAPDDILELV